MLRINKCVFLCAVLLACQMQISALAATVPAKNLDILDSMSLHSGRSICSFLKTEKVDSLRLQFVQHPARWLVEQHILNCGAREGIRFFYSDSSKQDNVLEVWVRDASVSYTNHPDETDSLIREVRLNVTGKLLRGDKIESLPAFSETARDTISRDEVPLIQSSAYDFAGSAVPEPQSSFFHEIAQPAIIITSVAIIVALLFTVRSK